MNTNKDNQRGEVSRQRAWQLAKLEEGLCSRCGENPIGSRVTQCDECTEKQNLAARERYAKRKKEKENAEV